MTAAAASVQICGAASGIGVKQIQQEGTCFPEPDDDLDGEPLTAADEKHLRLQAKLKEKKRRLMRKLLR